MTSPARSLRVAYLAAGAGGMYCGSCMRDNRVAATLITQGRDVMLMPLYTPLRTDERDVSMQRVYYGGINAFLQQKLALFRHTPWFVDRLLDAPSLLRGVGKLAAKTDAKDLGALTVSVLQGRDGLQRKELKKLIVGLRGLKPDCVVLPNLMFAGVARDLKNALNVPVLCTLAGEDIFLDALPDPYRTNVDDLITEHAAAIDAFISPTQYFSRLCIERFKLDPGRVRHVPMGISIDDCDIASPGDGPVVIGYLARASPEKGLAILCNAFARVRDAGHDCRLRVAGYVEPADRAYYEQAQASISQAGHGEHVQFCGELDRKGKMDFLRSLHVLSVPAVYHEAKGFYVLEAMACGVPVVQPDIGSFRELVEPAQAGLLYDPTVEGALEESLISLIENKQLRAKMGQAGTRAVRERHTDQHMADGVWAIIEEVC